MRDFKYIIKRIIIGVGIVLVLGFLNGCKVKAYDFSNDTPLLSVSFGSDRAYLYYNNEDNEMLFHRNKSGNYQNLTVSLNDYPYVYCTESVNIRCTFSTGELFAISNNNSGISNTYIPANILMYSVEFRASYNENFYNVNRITGPISTSNSYLYDYSEYGYNYISNYDIFYKDSNEIYINKNFNTLSQPEFISFNAIPITNNNVITSYTIQPEFSSFNTDSYVYQYSFDSNRWLFLTENEQILRINNNSTIYVRVKDKNTNEYIDGSTFTITNIGTFFDNQTYDIKFSGEYRTSDDLNNNSSGTNSIIMNYQIYVDYVPKSSILTYQYQYVSSGNSLDNNNWQNVPISDNGSITYVASNNGTLYARILDNENNVLKTATFTVNSIGKLAIDNDSNGVGGLFSKISNSINFAGPLSSIINIPIQLITTISSGLAGGLTCNDYSIGSLWGTNLVIPCVNVKQHLGNSLYTTIDLIIACCMIYHIIKMFGELYTNLLFMHKNPIQDLGKRSD